VHARDSWDFELLGFQWMRARHRACPPPHRAHLNKYGWFVVPPQVLPTSLKHSEPSHEWCNAALPVAASQHLIGAATKVISRHGQRAAGCHQQQPCTYNHCSTGQVLLRSQERCHANINGSRGSF